MSPFTVQNAYSSLCAFAIIDFGALALPSAPPLKNSWSATVSVFYVILVLIAFLYVLLPTTWLFSYFIMNKCVSVLYGLEACPLKVTGLLTWRCSKSLLCETVLIPVTLKLFELVRRFFSVLLWTFCTVVQASSEIPKPLQRDYGLTAAEDLCWYRRNFVDAIWTGLYYLVYF